MLVLIGAGAFLAARRRRSASSWSTTPADFAGQPEEEGTGYPHANLAEFANASGITGEKAGVFDIPTVKLNGENITPTLSTVDALVAQIKAATT